VKRLQIMIDEALDARLERMARDEGTSKAALVRSLVRERVAPFPAIQDDPLWGLVGMIATDDRPGAVDDVVYPR